MDVDGGDTNATRVLNDGPILRPADDILYLDKTFWRQYFERIDQDVDVFVPGVLPEDLAQVQKVAVDVAVLRNRDEFASVARAIGCNLPNVQTLWAIVTMIEARPNEASPEQIAHLDDGLLGVTDEEKVRLGIHDDVNYVPARGVVTANLGRLNIVGLSGNAVQVKYMLLKYFDDTLEILHGESADIVHGFVNDDQSLPQQIN
ncbi:unnamed protein product [Discula destructiva]